MSTDEELKERLREQADGLIEVIVASKKTAGHNNLQDLEPLTIRAGEGFEEQVLQTLVREESEGEEVPLCPECRRPMRSRGRRKRRVVTEAGEVEVERVYYLCTGCGKRSFPPG